MKTLALLFFVYILLLFRLPQKENNYQGLSKWIKLEKLEKLREKNNNLVDGWKTSRFVLVESKCENLL